MDSRKPEIRHRIEEGLLRITIQGQVDLAFVTDYVTNNRTLWMGASGVLWDVREMDPTRVTAQDILNIDPVFAETSRLPASERNAVLVRKELELIARIAAVIGESSDSPALIEVFLDEAQALEWLSGRSN